MSETDARKLQDSHAEPAQARTAQPMPDRPAPVAISYPSELPVSQRRDEIMAALRAHQVLVVCGETGSGKTTQLPKMALELAQALTVAPSAGQGRARWVGHTQPRRIAASSVARRIAQELGGELGGVVGYKVRFQDKLGPQTRIKLMTDGILLAETQSDPLLANYHTLIIDEAHERSLNIDFLLGYLKQLLPRRRDLKLIVTSATIDADRFAQHFASAQGPAPVIQVSGRMYPVEVRWQPFEASRERDINQALADAIDTLWSDPRHAGDVLIFLPGEREIRDAADPLRGHLQRQPAWRHADVLPLFARLSQAEQDRVFAAHSTPRIVLATNVAETSLTVPGIRYVIDAGTARVKRYSYRSKVEQLLIEPISQAAANQRAGRCGRVMDGVCVRLYDAADFAARPRFTDPELLRSSLAGVILRMKALHLPAIEDFAFIDPPNSRAIADGFQLLAELGAVDEAGALTDVGQVLARLPVDPRVGRMLLAAHQAQALSEMLVIAAALSVPDVRDRPIDQQAQADQAHAAFEDDKSEFSGLLRLWNWIHEKIGVRSPFSASENGDLTPIFSHRAIKRSDEALLRKHFIHVRRVREWRDLHGQLHAIVAEQGWRLNTTAATYEQLHQALLTGLLGNVGCKLEGDAPSGEYLGARGIKFWPHPGAHLRKKPGRWVMAAELVETTRLFGRGLAAIDPQWIERVGAHLLKKQVLDPHWEKKAAEVVAAERATLYGLVVYSGRRVLYSRVDAADARERFIRAALVEGDWDTQLPFVAANRRLIAQVQELEHKARRQDVLVDDELIFAFYDQHLPAEVCSGATLERWYRGAARIQPQLLKLSREELMRHEAAGITTDAFPRTLRLGGVDCTASYLHDPGDLRDGLSVRVPLFVLNQVQAARCEWLVPGMLKEKVAALLKTLPQRPRARLVPLAEAAAQFAQGLSAPALFGSGGLVDALAALVRERTGLEVKAADFRPDQLPTHTLMHFCVTDEHGRQLGAGRNLAQLKADLGAQARGAFAALAALRAPTQPAPNQTVSNQTAQNQPVSPVQRAQAATKSIASRGADPVRSGFYASVPGGAPAGPQNTGQNSPQSHVQRAQAAPDFRANEALSSDARYTDWTFGDLPELLEIRHAGQTLIGYPALIDAGDAVQLAVFDEPEAANRRHRAGLRRLFALQLRDALKHLDKNIPQLNAMAVLYLQVGRSAGGGTADGLRSQIVEVALERAFLADPLPTEAPAFKTRLDEGRSRLNLIAHEVARQAHTVLIAYGAASRKLKDSRVPEHLQADLSQQLERLVGLRFLAETPWSALQHLPRYLQAVVLRLDKWRSDPARDAARLAELKPLEQRWLRALAERRGVADARLSELGWLLQELRVSLFAQELRTPQPVSVKRLEKAWAQLNC